MESKCLKCIHNKNGWCKLWNTNDKTVKALCEQEEILVEETAKNIVELETNKILKNSMYGIKKTLSPLETYQKLKVEKFVESIIKDPSYYDIKGKRKEAILWELSDSNTSIEAKYNLITGIMIMLGDE